jgi:hypothetical protein
MEGRIMLKVIAHVVILCATLIGAPAAQDSVVGTWVLEIQGHQAGLGLEQNGSTLTGTLVIQGRNIPVEGEYVDRTFTLASAPDDPNKVKLSGKLKEDGTMEGDVETRHGTLRWQAERLKPPPVASSQ